MPSPCSVHTRENGVLWAPRNSTEITMFALHMDDLVLGIAYGLPTQSPVSPGLSLRTTQHGPQTNEKGQLRMEA